MVQSLKISVESGRMSLVISMPTDQGGKKPKKNPSVVICESAKRPEETVYHRSMCLSTLAAHLVNETALNLWTEAQFLLP